MGKILLVFCLIYLAACQKRETVSAGTTPPSTPSPQYKLDNQRGCLVPAIVGGQKIDNSHPVANHVVMILTFYENSSKEKKQISCTGTLLDFNTVLTAAHCFNIEIGSQPSTTYLIASTDLYCSSGYTKKLSYKADSVIIHPNYIRNSESSIDKPYYDLAIVKFKGILPPNYRSVRFPTESVKNISTSSKNLIMAGYGKSKTSDRSNPELRIVNKQANQIFLYKKDDRSGRLVDLIAETGAFGVRQLESQGVCHGDSGGPLLVNINNDYQILGVASSIDPNTPCERTNSYYTYTENYLDWIKSQL